MLYIIRHGQTSKNKAKLLQGRSDHPLNEDGRTQSLLAGEKLRALGVKPHGIYSSPLIRAIETAELAVSALTDPAKGATDADTCDVRIITDERLIEMDYGPYEGMDLTKPSPEVMAFFMDFAGTPAPDGMEQLHEVVSRVGEFLEEIRDEAVKGDVIISTHAIAMKGALEYLTPDSNGSYWAKYIGNCEIYAADVKEEGYGIPYSINGKDFDTEALRGV